MQILIKNATIYDGLGSKPFIGDVLTRGEKIEKISDCIKCFDKDVKVIDADKKIVCPGFVDIHRHCDAKVLIDEDFGRLETAQGITTTVVGNCGISIFPIKENSRDLYDFHQAVIGRVNGDLPKSFLQYKRKLLESPPTINLGTMIGMGAVKMMVKGFSATPFTREEIEKAKAIVEDALENGALGASLGIMYIPECYSSVEEMAEILMPLKKYNKPITAHIRGEGNSMVDSVKEAVEIARLVGVPLQISHFKSCGMKNWGKEIFRAIDFINLSRSTDLQISCDFYPYEGGSTSLTTMLPPCFVKGDLQSALKRLGTAQGVEEFRKASLIDYKDWDNYVVGLGWDKMIISAVEKEEFVKLVGLSVSDAAEKFGYEDGAELAAKLMHEENGKTTIIIMSIDKNDIDEIAKLPYSTVISDALYADTDTVHPRLYGAFPKIIREFVLERKILTMEQAIEKMTSMPARFMGIRDRGVLNEGAYADIIMFDPQKFKDNASFENGKKLATGLDFMMINGRIIRENEEFNNTNNGKFLYN